MADENKIATRLAFGRAIAEFGDDERIVVMDADLSGSTMTHVFCDKYPERHINCGIAEGNMMSTAAGLASCGKKVFAASFAMFATGRAYEQIRNSIGYTGLDVVIVGSHAGVTVGEDGASHQCIEDVSLMRSIPGMTVISPADGTEARAAVKALLKHSGPAYLRVARLAMPILFDPDTYEFEIGKGQVLHEGNDGTIISAGLLLHEANKAIEILEAEGISVRLVNMPTIKPVDADIIMESAEKTGAIVVAEEHSIIGGLGSAVSDVLLANKAVPTEIVGVRDKFGTSGKPDELLDLYELSAPHIVKYVKKAIARKNAQ